MTKETSDALDEIVDRYQKIDGMIAQDERRGNRWAVLAGVYGDTAERARRDGTPIIAASQEIAVKRLIEEIDRFAITDVSTDLETGVVKAKVQIKPSVPAKRVEMNLDPSHERKKRPTRERIEELSWRKIGGDRWIHGREWLKTDAASGEIVERILQFTRYREATRVEIEKGALRMLIVDVPPVGDPPCDLFAERRFFVREDEQLDERPLPPLPPDVR